MNMRLALVSTIPLLPMNSTKLQVLIWTLLAVFTSRTFSNLNYTTITPTTNTISPILNRHRRVASTAGVDDLLPQSEVCKAFVESKVVLKGAKAASPADIFNNLSIGKDFAMTGRKYAKNYVFQSPNYPRKYPNSIECFKLIVAPTQDHRIYLQISHPFAVEPDSLCAMDFLEVRDGAFGFSPLIGRFCSRLPPPENEEIRSTSRYLWLRFRSDSTLPHDGFRAIFHFQKVDDGQGDYEDPRPKMLRRYNVIHLSEDEQWTMRSEFLTKQLDYVSTEERQLPLEAVFDIRSPPETHILLHVHHFQVPLIAAWSCDPDFLAKQKAIKYCDFHSSSGSARADIFTEKSSNIIQVKQYTPSIPDPASYIDGTHTFIEIYTDGKTVSESSPPCPRVDRFCIASVHTDLSNAPGSSSSSSSASSSGSSSSSDKIEGDGHARRQFLVQSPRLVARLVVAKPSKPPRSTAEIGHVGVLEDGVDPFETAKILDIFSMLPNFTFTLTTLSPRAEGVCAPNQRACDEAYCIQTSHWCDGVINCPLGQDEGDAACNPEKAGVVENVEESDTTDMSEKDKAALERAMEEKEDLEKHAAIIGSISLTLIIVTLICMFFAIRRKRKEATHHVIEVKLPSDLDSPHLSGANANSSSKNITSSSLHPSKLLPKDVIIDLEDIENEPVFSSSGDALLGREPGSTQKAILGPTGLFANHNWDRKTSPAMTKAFGLSANSKSPSAKPGKSRNALFRHQQIQQQYQQKAQRGPWQSDVNLIQHSQIHSSRGKLHRGDSAQTADGVANFRYMQPQLPPRLSNPPPIAVAAKTRQPWSLRQQQQQQQREEHHNRNRSRSHQHHHHHHRHHHRHRRRQQQQKPSDKERHQPKQSVFLLRQKTNSTDVPDSSYQEGHVLNCRMLTEQQRTLSLATSRFRLYDSRELTPYGGDFSSSGSGSRSSSSLSASSASSSRSTDSTGSSSTSCSSNSTTTTSFCPRKSAPRDYRGYENLMPYSIRFKTFRSMPDVTRATGPPTVVSGGGVCDGSGGGGYQFAVSCGHKDCRDYYRLQALRSDLQMERRRPEKMGVEKPALFREREIELTPSSEDDDEGGIQNANSREGGDSGEKSIPLPNPIASDAYSVHGLSDAISVESSKDERSGSEATRSAVTDVSDESARQSSYTSTNSPISPQPPSRVSSANRPLSRVASLSKRLDSPASSRSRVRVHPAAPNLLVYEYEA